MTFEPSRKRSGDSLGTSHTHGRAFNRLAIIDKALSICGSEPSGRHKATVSVMRSLFNDVLLVLISFISGGNFPLDALSLIPLVTRRRLFLLLPMLDLHRLERHHPAATEGINMAKVWKEVFTERLCEGLRWLTESNTLQVLIVYDFCYFQLSKKRTTISVANIHQVLCAIPLTPDLAKERVRGLKGSLALIFVIKSATANIARTMHSSVHPNTPTLVLE